jgi:YidC/Oxa1 family membrane protein insertase
LEGNTISFKAMTVGGQYFEQKYTLSADYNINYDVHFEGMNSVLSQGNKVRLNWQNYLDCLERNSEYERTYSTVYYKEADENSNYCNCRNSEAYTSEKPIQWVAGVNQFFSTSLMAATTPFASAIVQTEMKDKSDADLKRIGCEVDLPYNNSGSETFNMMIYSGPNEFKRLESYKNGLQDVIPFGSSIFGTINRWLIRPLFNFLLYLFSSTGIVILLLTFLVKAVLFPLSYGMIKSQSKMTALKPQIDALKKKFGEDQQKMSTETMKLYQTYGVNPVGGCMPMLLQMPIWLALYRFFPAAIEFRQKSFLWATDLTSYDDFIKLGFEIPMFGWHVSLFTILWVVSTLLYTWYNSRSMDFSANPAMMYMQYIMPLMFMFAFNNYASGLTCYLVFSNFLNIAQTLITRNYIIDQDKILADLETNKNKPKTSGGFGDRIRKVMEQQQQIVEEQKGKGKKK